MGPKLLGVVILVGSIVSVVEAAPPYERDQIEAPTPSRRAPAATKAPDWFPLPTDAEAPAPTKGSEGRITTYRVPRGRDAVVTECRAALKSGGWEITKDEPSPSGNALRLTVKKNGAIWKASFTGDASRTVIILTSPAKPAATGLSTAGSLSSVRPRARVVHACTSAHDRTRRI
jgi:hypothetical protein